MWDSIYTHTWLLMYCEVHISDITSSISSINASAVFCDVIQLFYHIFTPIKTYKGINIKLTPCIFLLASLYLYLFLPHFLFISLSLFQNCPCLCLLLSHTCIPSKELYEACKVNWGHYSSCFMLMNWSALERLECDIISQLSWNCQSKNTCVFALGLGAGFPCYGYECRLFYWND